MKVKRLNLISLYVIVVIFFSLLIYWFLRKGAELDISPQPMGIVSGDHKGVSDLFVVNLKHPFAILLVQIILIMGTVRFFGWLCKAFRQPYVIGEMIAGIVIGPSLIGMYFPDFFALIFPVGSLSNLESLSKIGLVFFMFIVGMEVDLNVLRDKKEDAVIISHASILVPFSLGVGLSYYLYSIFAPEGIPFYAFSLFIGVAMSITAFPVLARIIQEKGMGNTKLGSMAITCAAADDITAWCILSIVIVLVTAGSMLSALLTVVLAIGYVIIMLKIVRPYLQKSILRLQSEENQEKKIAVIVFLCILLSALATEVIGIHALFGAFMSGVVMPENVRLKKILTGKVEDVAMILFLPLFFVLTGLRTQIGLLDDLYHWQIAGIVIFVAVVGKFAGSAIASKLVGQSWKNSLIIGALMNTRGLMELVVLNIGYDLGVLGPEIFSIMVMMALVTTCMTSPIIDLIQYISNAKKDALYRSSL